MRALRADQGLSGVEGSPRDSGGGAIVAAALEFLSRLGPAAEGAVRPFDHPGRRDWHYVPRSRDGLALGEMTAAQRESALALLRATLSGKGYEKATGIVELEGILREVEGGSLRRDPGRYHFVVYGRPSASAPWGWRIEGHHLSLHYTSVGGLGVATTPSFLGANPAAVSSGRSTGWRVLREEEELGRALVLALDPPRRARAVLSDTAPRDIVTGADRAVRLARPEGLPASAMDAAQREGLRRLVELYFGRVRDDLVAAHRLRLEEAGWDAVHFAWAGSVRPGEGHYYRIHGPTLLIEYDNVQNGANHIHTVWRDPAGDFGEDLLARHHREHPH